MLDFAPPDPNLFFSKNDPEDPRLGELAQRGQDSNEYEVALLGYADEEGVRLNGGRPGAALGPSAIRHALYRTTPHPQLELKTFRDLGDLKPNGLLSERHEWARQKVLQELQLGRQVLTLGGGNDFAYSDGRAFLDRYQGQRPLILNIDAHLDVREPKNGFNSGTPFYRLLESGVDFDFVELGIQGQCNAKAHWNYVVGKKGKIITVEEILESGLSLNEYCLDRLGDWLLRLRPAFLALDIDAFAWPYAAGSSAAWPMGLEPQAFWPLYTTLLKRLQVQVLGIYEVAPPLEAGPGTSKLAAQLAHRFLHRHV